ncbi:MAG: ABC transporter permease [Cyclobacteriaceae bacterium]
MHLIGSYVLFLKESVLRIQSYGLLMDAFFKECMKVGSNSLPIVSIVAIFTGGVSAIQTTYALSAPYIQDYVIGMVVRDTTFALIPTLIALVFAGKVGSRISGEFGSMQVSEQIDALEVMGVNSISFLALPVILASIAMVPVLIVIACFLSLTSGYFSVMLLDLITGPDYITGIRYEFNQFIVSVVFVKAFSYGFLVSSISAFSGFNTRGGALEVGKSNTRAIVQSSILILVADYFITNFMVPIF